MPDLTNYATTEEAAEELGFHVNRIRRMIRCGDLETTRVGHILFVSKDSIRKYKESAKGQNKHSPLKREKLKNRLFRAPRESSAGVAEGKKRNVQSSNPKPFLNYQTRRARSKLHHKLYMPPQLSAGVLV